MTIEGLFVEINLRTNKWLLYCSYNPTKSHLQETGNNFDLFSSKFDNYLLIGYFNAESKEPVISNFVKFIIL